jgi:hypothetical protein
VEPSIEDKLLNPLVNTTRLVFLQLTVPLVTIVLWDPQNPIHVLLDSTVLQTLYYFQQLLAKLVHLAPLNDFLPKVVVHHVLVVITASLE